VNPLSADQVVQVTRQFLIGNAGANKDKEDAGTKTIMAKVGVWTPSRLQAATHQTWDRLGDPALYGERLEEVLQEVMRRNPSSVTAFLDSPAGQGVLETLMDKIHDDSARSRKALSAFLRTILSREEYRDVEEFANLFFQDSKGVRFLLGEEKARQTRDTEFQQPPALQRTASGAYTVNEKDGTVGVCSTMCECLVW